MSRVRRLLFIGGLLAAIAASLGAAVSLPPKPANHFNDYAGAVSAAAGQRLNAELAQFERETSNQIVVALFPRLPDGAEVTDYTVRAAQAWGVGTKERRNGAVLFFFIESHDIRIATGYGLEGVLPDALCKRIIANEIVPRLRAGDFDGGVTAGAEAMMAAAKGEYRGTGRTVREAGARNGGSGFGVLVVVFIILSVLSSIVRGRRNTFYSSRGRRGVWVQPPWGGGSGGGWSGGGGGSFSGGGGGFGGGGAGGKW